ncbi:MAG: 30S ribosomal protein S12 methylthiotransferase RimO [Spirochaetes bacterium]|nr:30S ribosomal protein S12 methylthiotransferase RimO [Spirochaetota bacterium]
MKNKSVFFLSLGCSRNTVDSETMMTLLERAGHTIVENPKEAEVLVVNTCAFIDEAKQESIDTILALSQKKQPGSRLVVTGCFSQLYHKEILQTMPEVDAVAGIGNLGIIIDTVEKTGTRDYPQARLIDKGYSEYTVRSRLITKKGYAYLKVSEGCSGSCSFCLIPLIKGPMRSRKSDAVVEDALRLIDLGTKEIVLTSQDTLAYGRDLGMKNGISSLVENILKKTSIERIRVLYLNPHEDLMRILEIFGEDRVLPYFDIPIQHASEKVLASMHRQGGGKYYRELVSRIKERVPGAVFRTGVIVGYPHEREEDFRVLLDFIREVEFNHLGVFVFSPQRETEAAGLGGRVKKRVAEKRRDEVLQLQRTISAKMLAGEIGKFFDVLVEERVQGENIYFGRSYHFAPEVDGVFVLRSEELLEPGSIVKAKVTRADDYDLHGVVHNG